MSTVFPNWRSPRIETLMGPAVAHPKRTVWRGSPDLHMAARWRARMGLTQLAAARLLGVGEGSIQRWEQHLKDVPMLEPAMRYHELMEAHIEDMESTWLSDPRDRELLAAGDPTPAVWANVSGLTPADLCALDYALMDRRWAPLSRPKRVAKY